MLECGANPFVKTKDTFDCAFDLCLRNFQLYESEKIILAEDKWVNVNQVSFNSSAYHNLNVVCINQNQRFRTLSGRFDSCFLLKSDSISEWSNDRYIETSKDEFNVDIHWVWLSDWTIDLKHPQVDHDGWMYAFDFKEPQQIWTKESLSRLSGVVRKRRWFRLKERKVKIQKK